ncbi:hypothetical protein BR93DRAFT_94511 [Coniochaeta sp. PMI_546]|nr:hypothetical protein BR93DRAFT_94511 [Coniochaeta sp. PMI_546]
MSTPRHFLRPKYPASGIRHPALLPLTAAHFIPYFFYFFSPLDCARQWIFCVSTTSPCICHSDRRLSILQLRQARFVLQRLTYIRGESSSEAAPPPPLISTALWARPNE